MTINVHRYNLLLLNFSIIYFPKLYKTLKYNIALNKSFVFLFSELRQEKSIPLTNLTATDVQKSIESLCNMCK